MVNTSTGKWSKFREHSQVNCSSQRCLEGRSAVFFMIGETENCNKDILNNWWQCTETVQPDRQCLHLAKEIILYRLEERDFCSNSVLVVDTAATFPLTHVFRGKRVCLLYNGLFWLSLATLSSSPLSSYTLHTVDLTSRCIKCTGLGASRATSMVSCWSINPSEETTDQLSLKRPLMWLWCISSMKPCYSST